MIRSRLRKPTSKSTRATFLPVFATAAPRAAVEVVFPTPPLPDVTTTTLPIYLPPFCWLSGLSVERRDAQHVVFQKSLDRFSARRGLHLLGGAIPAVHRQQFGFVPAAENARPGVSL